MLIAAAAPPNLKGIDVAWSSEDTESVTVVRRRPLSFLGLRRTLQGWDRRTTLRRPK